MSRVFTPQGKPQYLFIGVETMFYIRKLSTAVAALENAKYETIAEARNSPAARGVLKTEIENIEHVVSSLKREVARLAEINDESPTLAGVGL